MIQILFGRSQFQENLIYHFLVSNLAKGTPKNMFYSFAQSTPSLQKICSLFTSPKCDLQLNTTLTYGELLLCPLPTCWMPYRDVRFRKSSNTLSQTHTMCPLPLLSLLQCSEEITNFIPPPTILGRSTCSSARSLPR